LSDDLRGTSGVIILGTIPMTGSDGATARPPHDEGEPDKTGDESRHHPQQKPLVRFHLSFGAECPRARRSLALEGSVTAMVRSDLAKVRQSFALRCQPQTMHRRGAPGGCSGQAHQSRSCLQRTNAIQSLPSPRCFSARNKIGSGFLAEENDLVSWRKKIMSPGLASLRRLRISRRTANGYTRLLCNYLWHEMEIWKRCYAQGSYVDYFVRTPSRHSVIHSAHTFSQKGLQSDQLDQRTILVQDQSRQFGCGSFRPA